MKVLVVTGLKAKAMVENYVQMRKSKVEVDVFTLPIPVAALITPAYAAKKLAEAGLKSYDLILMPGSIRGSVEPVGEALKIPVFKGPRHAADLPEILDHLEELTLSPVKPACELAAEILAGRIEAEVKALRMEALRRAEAGLGILLQRGEAKAWWAPGFQPILLAEIADASRMGDEEIGRVARWYVKSGADMVDVGMEAGGGKPDEAERAVKAVLKAVKVPVSIDSADPEELLAGVRAGASLILSGDASNLKALREVRDVPIVVTPAGRDGTIPENFLERVERLEENLAEASRLGFKRLIADPILSLAPPYSLLDSILGYWEFSRRKPGFPTFFGAGNVTELSEVDSPGLNFALALLGWELGVAFLFTVEASRKTVGSVSELSKALNMLALASKRRTPPKDLPLNLLILKEKRCREEPPTPGERPERLIKVNRADESFHRDPKGSFKIRVDREHGEILVLHYEAGAGRPSTAIRGSRPEAIYRAIVRENLISLPDHAAYLGFELGKALVALKTGRSYVQDEDVF